MVKRAVLGYLAVELLAVVGLVWAFGVGWALAILAGTFLIGVLLAGSQLRRQLGALSQARRAGSDPRAALTDGALVGLGAGLVLLPGVVTTAAGSLLLAPPTRGAMRPVAAALLTRGVVRRIGGVTVPPWGTPRPGHYGGVQVVDGEVVDGEVVDGEVIDGENVITGGNPPNLPARR